MLDKIHVDVAHIRRENDIPIAEGLGKSCPSARIFAVAIRFGIRIAGAACAFVTLEAGDKTRRLLVEVHVSDTAVQCPAVACRVIVKVGELLLIEATFVTVTFFARAVNKQKLFEVALILA